MGSVIINGKFRERGLNSTAEEFASCSECSVKQFPQRLERVRASILTAGGVGSQNKGQIHQKRASRLLYVIASHFNINSSTEAHSPKLPSTSGQHHQHDLVLLAWVDEQMQEIQEHRSSARLTQISFFSTPSSKHPIRCDNLLYLSFSMKNR